MRMAEVWMDDYKRLFYVHHTDLKDKKVSDVSDRLALREKLQCKPFSWFTQFRPIMRDGLTQDGPEQKYPWTNYALWPFRDPNSCWSALVVKSKVNGPYETNWTVLEVIRLLSSLRTDQS